MKKTLLLSLAVAIGLSAYTQDKKSIKNTVSATSKVKVEPKANPANTVVNAGERYYPIASGNKTGAVINLIPIGTSANAYGAIGKKTELWADPRINTVTYVHRGDVAPGSGYLMYDVSKDGGSTWAVNQGPIYTPAASGAPFPARYPQGVIYNPAGNTNPDDAYLSYHAATLTTTNGGSWGGLGYGVQKLDGVTPPTQHEDDVVNFPGFWWQVPFNMTITQDGESWVVDTNDSLTATVNNTGHMWIAKGTHSAGDVSYTRTLITAQPSSFGLIGTPDIAFGASGNVGYIGVYGHMDDTFEPDSLFYLIVWKTTDGGNSWGLPIQINVSTLVDPILNSAVDDKYNTGFDVDLAVDMNDNLHIFVAAGPGGGFSIGTDPGDWGMFDIHTTDGGTTWDAMLIAKPMNFRGTFDPNAASPLPEDSRGQIAKTMDGSKLFFVYFDTDTIIAQENIFPDVWVRGYDVVTGFTTNLMNMTGGSQADGLVSFGAVAHWVFQGVGNYEIPVAFQALNNDQTLQPTQFFYIDDIIINDSDFNSSINENNGNITSAGIYPNPLTNNATIRFGLASASNVSVTILNTLGMKVMEINKGKVEAGSHEIEISRENLTSGMYFYSITAGDHVITKKMVVK